MDREMGISVTGDASDIESTLEDLQNSLEAFADIIINIDVNFDKDTLNELEDRLITLDNLLISIDISLPSNIDSQISEIENSLNSLDAYTVTVDVNANIADVEGDVANIQSELSTLDTTIATVTVDLEDLATEGLQNIESLISEIAGQVVSISTDSTEVENLDEAILSLENDIVSVNSESIEPKVDSSGIAQASNDTSNMATSFHGASLAGDDLGHIVGAIGAIWASNQIEGNVLELNKAIEKMSLYSRNAEVDTGKLMDTIRGSFTAKVGMQEVANGMLILTQTTGNANSAMTMIKGAMDMVKVSGASLTSSVTTEADIMEKFGLSAQEASDAMDYLAAASTRMKMPGDQINRIVDRMSSDFESLGLSVQDSVDVLAAFDMSGINSREIMMGLRSGMTGLIGSWDEASPKLAKVEDGFHKLGIATRDAQGNLLPLGPLVMDAANKLGSMENSTYKSQIAMEIFGTRAQKTWGQLRIGPADAAAQYRSSAGDIVDRTKQINTEFMTLSQSMGKLGAWFTSLVPAWAAKIGALALAIVGGFVLVQTLVFPILDTLQAKMATGAIAETATISARFATMATSVVASIRTIIIEMELLAASTVQGGFTAKISAMATAVLASLSGMTAGIRVRIAEAVASLQAGNWGIVLGTITNAFVAFASTLSTILATSIGYIRAFVSETMLAFRAGGITAVISTFISAIATALRGLWAIMVAHPIGALVIALGLLAGALLVVADRMGMFKSSQEKFDEAIKAGEANVTNLKAATKQAGEQVAYWQDQVSKSIPGTAQYSNAVKQLENAQTDLRIATDAQNKAENDLSGVQQAKLDATKRLTAAENELRHAHIAYLLVSKQITQTEADDLLAKSNSIAAADTEIDRLNTSASEIEGKSGKIRGMTDAYTDQGPALNEVNNLSEWSAYWAGAAADSTEDWKAAVKAKWDWGPFQVFAELLAWIIGKIYGESPGLIPGIQEVQRLLSLGFITSGITALGNAISGAIGGIYNIGGTIAGIFGNAVNSILNNGMILLNTLRGLLPGVTSVISGIGSAIMGLGSWINSAFINALNILGSVGNRLLDGLKGVLNTVIGTFNSFVSWLPTLGSNLLKGIGNAFGSIITGIKNALSPITTILKNVENTFWRGVDWIVNLPKTFYDYGFKIFDQFKQGILKSLGPVAGALKVIADYLEAHSPPKKGPLSSIDTWGQNLGSTYVQSIASGISGNAFEVTDALGAIGGGTSLLSTGEQQLIVYNNNLVIANQQLLALQAQTAEIAAQNKLLSERSGTTVTPTATTTTTTSTGTATGVSTTATSEEANVAMKLSSTLDMLNNVVMQLVTTFASLRSALSGAGGSASALLSSANASDVLSNASSSAADSTTSLSNAHSGLSNTLGTTDSNTGALKSTNDTLTSSLKDSGTAIADNTTKLDAYGRVIKTAEEKQKDLLAAQDKAKYQKVADELKARGVEKEGGGEYTADDLATIARDNAAKYEELLTQSQVPMQMPPIPPPDLKPATEAHQEVIGDFGIEVGKAWNVMWVGAGMVVGGLVLKYSDTVRSAVSTAGNTIKGFIGRLVPDRIQDPVVNGWRNFSGAAEKAESEASERASKAIDEMTKSLVKDTEGIGTKVSKETEKAATKIEKSASGFRGRIQTAFQEMSEKLRVPEGEDIATRIRTFFSKIKGAFTSEEPTLIGKITDVAGNIAKGIGDWSVNVGNAFADGLKGISTKIGEIVTGYKTPKVKLDLDLSGISDTFTKMEGEVTRDVEGASGRLGSILDRLKKPFTEIKIPSLNLSERFGGLLKDEEGRIATSIRDFKLPEIKWPSFELPESLRTLGSRIKGVLSEIKIPKITFPAPEISLPNLGKVGELIPKGISDGVRGIAPRLLGRGGDIAIVVTSALAWFQDADTWYHEPVGTQVMKLFSLDLLQGVPLIGPTLNTIEKTMNDFWSSIGMGNPQEVWKKLLPPETEKWFHESLQNIENWSREFWDNITKGDWEGAKKPFQQLYLDITGYDWGGAISGISSTITGGLSGIGGNIQGALGGAYEWLTGGFRQAQQWFTSNPIFSSVQGAIGGFLAWLPTIGPSLFAGAGMVWGMLLNGFNSVAGILQSVIGTPQSLLQGLWNWMTTIGATIGGVAANVWKALTSGFNSVIAILQGAIDTPHKALQGLWDWMTGIVGNVRTIASNIWNALVGGWNAIVGTVRAVIDVPRQALQGLWDWFNGMVGNFFNVGKAIIDNFVKGMVGSIPGLQEFLQFLRDHWPASPPKLGPLSDMDTWGTSMATTVSDSINSGFPTVASTMQSNLANLQSTVNSTAITAPALATGTSPTTTLATGGVTGVEATNLAVTASNIATTATAQAPIIKTAIDTMMKPVNDITATFAMLPDKAAMGIAGIGARVVAAVGVVPAQIAPATAVLQTATTALMKPFTDLPAQGVASLNSFKEQVIRTLPAVKTSIDTALNGEGGLYSVFARFGNGVINVGYNSGTQFTKAIAMGLGDGFTEGKDALNSALNKIFGYIKGYTAASNAKMGPLSDIMSWGGRIVNAIFDGINSSKPSLTGISDVFAIIKTEFNKAVGEGFSPEVSKKMQMDLVKAVDKGFSPDSIVRQMEESIKEFSGKGFSVPIKTTPEVAPANFALPESTVKAMEATTTPTEQKMDFNITISMEGANISSPEDAEKYGTQMGEQMIETIKKEMSRKGMPTLPNR